MVYSFSSHCLRYAHLCDLAIIELRMSKTSGFQVYQILAALRPTIKALFVSALDHVDEVLTALRGIDSEADFIRKPVSQERLVTAVNRKIKLYAEIWHATLLSFIYPENVNIV